MGNDAKGEKNEAYQKRTAPLRLDQLTLVKGEPKNTAVVIIQREKDNYLESAKAFSKIEHGKRADERIKIECELFKNVYETKCEMVTPKTGGAYWLVETTYTKEKKCFYRNWFKLDGEIVAESNYHPTVNTTERLGNSTVMWCQYKFLVDNGKNPARITKLRRHEVSNQQTNDTARVCFLLNAKMDEFPEAWFMVWKPGDIMNVLLGTPNGKAGFFLVRDWAKI